MKRDLIAFVVAITMGSLVVPVNAITGYKAVSIKSIKETVYDKQRAKVAVFNKEPTRKVINLTACPPYNVVLIIQYPRIRNPASARGVSRPLYTMKMSSPKWIWWVKVKTSISSVGK